MTTTTNHNLLEEIAPENLTPKVLIMLGYTGTKVTATLDPYDGSTYIEYEFPEETAHLFIVNDDSWGPIIGLYVNDGHLIIIGSYGDEGEFEFSFTHPEYNTTSFSEICVTQSLHTLHPLLVDPNYSPIFKLTYHDEGVDGIVDNKLSFPYFSSYFEEMEEDSFGNNVYDDELLLKRKSFIKQLTPEQISSIVLVEKYADGFPSFEQSITTVITFSSGDILAITLLWICDPEVIQAFSYTDSRIAKATIISYLKEVIE